jgi:hypothetical protein
MLSFNQFINESKEKEEKDSFDSLKKGDTVQWSAKTSKILKVDHKNNIVYISGQGDREIMVNKNQWIKGNGKLKSTNKDDK